MGPGGAHAAARRAAFGRRSGSILELISIVGTIAATTASEGVAPHPRTARATIEPDVQVRKEEGFVHPQRKGHSTQHELVPRFPSAATSGALTNDCHQPPFLAIRSTPSLTPSSSFSIPFLLHYSYLSSRSNRLGAPPARPPPPQLAGLQPVLHVGEAVNPRRPPARPDNINDAASCPAGHPPLSR